MWIPTRRERLRRPTSADAARLCLVAGLAVGLALVELLFGVFRYYPQAAPRAEALDVLAVRPWLLVPLALAAGRLSLPWRVSGYAGFLLLAGVTESLYLIGIGNPDPWPKMVRGWAAAILLLAPVDLALHLARRTRTGWAPILLAAGILLLFALPAALAPYRAIVVGAAADRPAQTKPELLLMTALPIVWGEGGAFDPHSRPALAYRALQEAFAIRPIDSLDARTLGGARLLLLAHPRWLAPAELIAVDDWARGGGRILILTDPQLQWPTDLPLGDIRRPPPIGLLKPLLDHWGLAIAGVQPGQRVVFNGQRRLVFDHPGRFVSRVAAACRVIRAYRAECRLGAGRATLIADADLLRDDLWSAPGPDGDTRHRRLADNPLALANMLDRLSGFEREPVRAAVRWASPTMSPRRALILAILPLLGVLAAALAASGLLHRRRSA